jgi:hypothetical protein
MLKHFIAHIGTVYIFLLNSVSLKICQYLKRDNPGNDCSGRVNPDRRTLRDVTICSDPQESHASLLFCLLFPFRFLLSKSVLRIWSRSRIQMFLGLPDPDQSISMRCGSGSISFYHQAKIVRKPLILLFCGFMTFYL